MKIFVIGATGMAGSAIVAEAVKRGHEVIANGRTAEKLVALKGESDAVSILVKDAFKLDLQDFIDVDVVINAYATAPAKAYLHVDLATHLIHLLREKKAPRLGFILGAGSLTHDDHLLLDEILADPSTAPWREVPLQQKDELTFLETVKNVNWFGISPAQIFQAGPASTTILRGRNEVLFDSNGVSMTTSGTMAIGMLDEIEHPAIKRARFTIANG